MDANKDGVLDLEEIIFGLSVLHRGDTEQKLKLFFDCFDADRDGCLSATELRKAVACIQRIAGIRGAVHIFLWNSRYLAVALYSSRQVPCRSPH
jgi:Ca2+-binding EF-hand superfamily protein